MRLFYILCLLIYSLAMNACRKEYSPVAASNDKIEVKIGQSIKIGTRTSIADDGTTAIWSGNDKFAVWAMNADGEFAITGTTFSMWRYDDTTSSAIFTATISPMRDGLYTYYATYPEPVSANDMYAVYNLPQEQSAATFNGDYDIMVAKPVKNASALTESGINELNFGFSHKMHAIKVNIPLGGNLLGMPVTKIEFTFPTNVTGDVSVDITDPYAPATLSNGSNKLILNIPDGVVEGQSAWGMIFPTDISGDITYTAYSNGYASFPKTFSISKEASEAHVTPMSLYIPELYRLTEISLSIGDNYLGENVQSISVLDESGELVKTFEANDNNEYILSFEGTFDDAPFSEKRFIARFESEHAIVEQAFTMPRITPYIKNVISAPIDVPYLFYEDFSNVETISSYDTYTSGSNATASSAVSFLSGWSGGRIGAQEGTSIRIAARRETSARYYGRVDSAPLSNIKEGASVNVEVSFNYGMGRQEGGLGSSPKLGQTCDLGYTTDSSALNSQSSTGTFVDSVYINETTGTYDYLPNAKSYTIENAESATRMTWRSISDSNSGLTNGTFWFYIDNVTVKIKEQ